MLKRALLMAGVPFLLCAGSAAAAPAAGPPPLPTASNGHTVQVFASGVTTPTSFAFGAGRVFEGDAGNPPKTPGGVYVLHDGRAQRLAESPPFVAGLVWHKGTLYVSSGKFGPGGTITWQILAWSGWKGQAFTKHRVFYTAPKDFPGFNGLAVGPDSRLYAGVSLPETGDHAPAKAPFQYDILTFGLAGKGPKVFASGIRQPWQIAFAHGSSSPFVTDLGQEADAKNPPDFLLHVHKGDNFGFPGCNWTVKKACRGFAKPFHLFAPHTDPGGIAIVGRTIYVSEFGMGGRPPQVVALPVKGGKARTLLSGFVAPVIGLGAHGQWLFVGSVDGNVYRVHL